MWWNRFAWVAFMGRTFTFHAGLGLVVVLAWMALCRLWKPVLVLLPILGWAIGPAAWSYVPKRVSPLTGDTITVMSVNLLIGSGSDRAAADLILREQPDVVVLQEYSDRAHAALHEMLHADYLYVAVVSRDDAFGQAVYSRRPFVGTPVLYPPATLGTGRRAGGVVNLSDPQIRVVVEVGGREVVIQNIHTTPPVSGGQLAEQRAMIRWLAGWTRDEARPVILAGDFNATRESLGVLRDAGTVSTHDLAGTGRGSTWIDTTPLRYLPGVRIDHVLISGGLACDRSMVLESIGSDHRPILARVGF